MGTVADWDTRKSEIIWGQKAACRAVPGTFATLRGCQGCPLTSEVTWGQKAKDPPLGFCAGDGLGRRALSQKIQGVKSLQVLQESPPTPKLTWPENETH